MHLKTGDALSALEVITKCQTNLQSETLMCVRSVDTDTTVHNTQTDQWPPHVTRAEQDPADWLAFHSSWQPDPHCNLSF